MQMNWLSFRKQQRTAPSPQATPPVDNEVAVRSREKILVVDDDAIIIKTTSSKLKSRGYQVVTATDAAEAMSAVRQHKPDLILLDISFPPDVGVDWDGLKIIAWMQRMDEAKNIPIIVVSGSEPEKFKDRCLATGARAFFYKPVQYDQLLPFIAHVLRKERGQLVSSSA